MPSGPKAARHRPSRAEENSVTQLLASLLLAAPPPARRAIGPLYDEHIGRNSISSAAAMDGQTPTGWWAICISSINATIRQQVGTHALGPCGQRRYAAPEQSTHRAISGPARHDLLGQCGGRQGQPRASDHGKSGPGRSCSPIMIQLRENLSPGFQSLLRQSRMTKVGRVKYDKNPVRKPW